MIAHQLCELEALPDGIPTRFEIAGHPMVVVRLGELVYALEDRCSHANVALSDGDIWPDDCAIECPKHGAQFSLASGDALTLPATRSVTSYPTSTEDGVVTVQLPVPELDQS